MRHERLISAAHAARPPTQQGGLGQWLHDQGAIGGALIGASVAVGLFAVTRLLEALAAAARRKSLLRSVLIGLFVEIDLNQRGISQWLEEQPNPTQVTEAVKTRPDYRPLVIASYNTDFLKASTPSLTALKTKCLIRTLEFYESLEEYRNIAESFESAAFATLTSAGRVSLVEDFWKSMRKAERLAREAHASFELEYPRRWFADLRS